MTQRGTILLEGKLTAVFKWSCNGHLGKKKRKKKTLHACHISNQSWNELTGRQSELRLENQDGVDAPELSPSKRKPERVKYRAGINHAGIYQSQNLNLEVWKEEAEWQHFLHAFGVPQYGKHFSLLKEKCQVMHWLFLDCLGWYFWINLSLGKGSILSVNNNKLRTGGAVGLKLDCVV